MMVRFLPNTSTEAKAHSFPDQSVQLRRWRRDIAFNGSNSFAKLSHCEIQTHHHGKVDNGSQEVGSVSHARVIVPE